MASADDDPADESAAGRHAGSAARLSAADLIARSAAAATGLPARPSRSARQAAAADGVAQPADTGSADTGSADRAAADLEAADVEVAGVEAADLEAANLEAARVEAVDLEAVHRAAADLETADVEAADLEMAEPPSAEVARPEISPATPAPVDIQSRDEQSDQHLPLLRHLAVVDEPVAITDRGSETVVRSRAGRNLPAAIGVGLTLGGLVLGTLYLYRPSFVVLVTVAMAIAVYEMTVAIATVEARAPLVPLLVGVVAMQAAAWFRGSDGLVGALLLTVLAITVWRLADGAAGYLRDVAAGDLIALYVPFLAGFAALMTHPDDGAARIVIFMLSVVCSDTGGYAAGVLIGKHPMAPTVSPKKSWEGFAGSILASGTCGVLIMRYTFHQHWWQGALFGVAIAITATLGDLGESMIKRDLGLKDMGRLLPGHGGIMDRLDSVLPCAPVAYLLLAAFLPR